MTSDSAYMDAILRVHGGAADDDAIVASISARASALGHGDLPVTLYDGPWGAWIHAAATGIRRVGETTYPQPPPGPGRTADFLISLLDGLYNGMRVPVAPAYSLWWFVLGSATGTGVDDAPPFHGDRGAANFPPIAFVSDAGIHAVRRPGSIFLDQLFRPHNADGPAVEWHDGSRWYAWHGVPVPSWVIQQRETLTGSDVLGIRNTEQRRAAIEAIGPHKLGRIIVLDEDIHPTDGRRRLVRIETQDGSWVMTHVIDPSTGREYYEGAPPQARTVKEAVAAQYGFQRADDYAPAERV